MPTDAQTLINQAISLGYDKLCERELKECILAAASSGGGGAVSQIIAGTGISVSPVGGTGAVTVTNTASAGGSPAPGVVDPNGVVTGKPDDVYFNTAASTFWVQASAVTANTGWIQLI